MMVKLIYHTRIIVILSMSFIIIWSCSKIENSPNENQTKDSIEILKSRFYQKEREFKLKKLKLKKNFRQSLDREIRWDEIKKGTKAYYVPIYYLLPSGTVNSEGLGYLDMQGYLRIPFDDSSTNIEYVLLNFIPDSIGEEGFSGTILEENYFSGGVSYNIRRNGQSLKRSEIFNRKAGMSTGELKANGGDCYTYWVSRVCVGQLDGGPGSEICHDNYETTCIYNPDMPIDYEEVGPEDGGGGNPGPGPAPVVIIKNDIDDPCVDKLINRIKTSGSTIATILNQVFGGNQTEINMTFYSRASSEMDGNDAYIEGGNLITDAKIYISDSLIAHASQEYLIATIYHEAWHAYLEIERWKLGNTKFAQKYPTLKSYDTPGGKKYTFLENAQHNRFSSFIDLIKSEIKNFNSKLPDDVIEALALSGLFSDLDNEIKLLNGYERDSRNEESQGTICK